MLLDALFGLFRPRCGVCGYKIDKGLVPKHIKMADGTWKKVHKKCYTATIGNRKPQKPGFSR